MIIYIYRKKLCTCTNGKKERKKKHTHIDLQLSSMNNASVTKNFTNFTIINVASCE